MSIIMDSFNADAVMLTVTQKSVLAVVYNAPTPLSALEAINGTPELVTARNILERLGLVIVTNGAAALTEKGNKAVIANNIADMEGNLTEEGQALINAVATPLGEGFVLLPTLIGS
jgi:predicted methyltransferase